MAVMVTNKHPHPFLFTSSRFSLFCDALQIQGVHSFGSYYMSVDRYLQLENAKVNSLQVSKDLYKIETFLFLPDTYNKFPYY